MQDGKKEIDVFERDWNTAREHWKRKHRVWDYNYLTYRSVLTYNDIYGEKYLKAFGLQVFVPRTFQTVESLSSAILAKDTSFTVKGLNLLDNKKSKYFERMDNVEWKRSGAEEATATARRDALIYGMGHILNCYVEDTETLDFPVNKAKENEKPEEDKDGQPEEQETALPKNKKEIEWEKKEVIRYRGMKPEAIDPYYCFPDPSASDAKSRRYLYRYKIWNVDELRDWVVGKGWMDEKEAAQKIQPTNVEYFDAIRDTIDWMYQMPLNTGYTRGNHADPNDAALKPYQRPTENMVATIERYEKNYYECRLADQTPLYSDFNVYPHKKIPVVTFYNYKIEHRDEGMGEPEIIRHQQLEENKIHNFVLQTLLMSIVQRYAVHADLLDDENDLYMSDPFKPIRLKSLPGLSVQQAIMPMPQPDVKQIPFELMGLVKDTLQATSGASDFIVSANDASTNTATESNNLMAATTGRIRGKIRAMEPSLREIVEQWHTCFAFFYDQEMDLLITGDDQYYKYLPYNREEADENPVLMARASQKYDAVGDTLEEIYRNAGFADVIYLSDLMGEMVVSVQTTDPEINKDKTVVKFSEAIRLMNEANNAAKMAGDTRQFDSFKLAKDALANFDFIKDISEYVKGEGKQALQAPVIPPPQPEPAMNTTNPNIAAEMPAMPMTQ